MMRRRDVERGRMKRTHQIGKQAGEGEVKNREKW